MQHRLGLKYDKVAACKLYVKRDECDEKSSIKIYAKASTYVIG